MNSIVQFRYSIQLYKSGTEYNCTIQAQNTVTVYTIQVLNSIVQFRYRVYRVLLYNSGTEHNCSIHVQKVSRYPSIGICIYFLKNKVNESII